jgi:AbrB family transcriptional regulator, transcriptional pleiotropic regulator of transition state genes
LCQYIKLSIISIVSIKIGYNKREEDDVELKDKIKKVERGEIMKSTGVVRKIDELGRVVLPVKPRRNLNINEKDSIEIFIDNDKIIFKKYSPHKACIVTGTISPENRTFGDSKIVLSPEGAKLLIQELQDYVEVKI